MNASPSTGRWSSCSPTAPRRSKVWPAYPAPKSPSLGTLYQSIRLSPGDPKSPSQPPTPCLCVPLYPPAHPSLLVPPFLYLYPPLVSQMREKAPSVALLPYPPCLPLSPSPPPRHGAPGERAQRLRGLQHLRPAHPLGFLRELQHPARGQRRGSLGRAAAACQAPGERSGPRAAAGATGMLPCLGFPLPGTRTPRCPRAVCLELGEGPRAPAWLLHAGCPRLLVFYLYGGCRARVLVAKAPVAEQMPELSWRGPHRRPRGRDSCGARRP